MLPILPERKRRQRKIKSLSQGPGPCVIPHSHVIQGSVP